MNELPLSILRSVRTYEPIITDGLTLYPVLVEEYDSFLIARTALEVLHQSLPVAMMRIPLLSALYQMDYEAAASGKTPTGLFSRALLALALALRLGQGKEPVERVGLFQLAAERDKPQTLACLRFLDESGETKEIKPAQFNLLRQIIAAQNGVKLESDTANPDLVKAQKLMASANAMPLDANIDDLIAAVAALSGAEESDIIGWPILKLEKRSDSYRRILDYLVCGVGEVSGTTWKGGNPNPHPFFKRIRDGNGVLSVIGGTADGSTKTAPKAQEIYQQSRNL